MSIGATAGPASASSATADGAILSAMEADTTHYKKWTVYKEYKEKVGNGVGIRAIVPLAKGSFTFKKCPPNSNKSRSALAS